MNCKPGDLAVIINSGAIENIGALVEVIALAPMGVRLIVDDCPFMAWHEAAWIVETRGRLLRNTLGNDAPGDLVERKVHIDRYLKPIRDPGEEAQDETLAWKPVPLPTLEPA